MISRLALCAAMALGSTALLVPGSADAQDPAAATVSPSGRTLSLSKSEREALAPLVTAMQAGDYAAASAALPAAQAAANGNDARYVVAAQQLRLGVQTNNLALQSSAIKALIASGEVTGGALAGLYRDQASLALSAGDTKAAEAALSKVAELTPNDPDVLGSLAQLRMMQKNYRSVVALLDRAVDLKLAASQPVSEAWYKYGLNYAIQTAMAPQALKFARELIAAYPTPRNWRDVLLIYRDTAKPDRATELDVYRLMRLTKALSGERDYLAFGGMLDQTGFPGETKSLLDEAVAANMVDPAKVDVKQLRTRTTARAAADRKSLAAQERSALAAVDGTKALAVGDSYLGYGDYAKAIALYRAALQKGSADPNVVNTHLGVALALSGQNGEAEGALRAVTGPRAELAGFYLIWLARRG